jgi:mannose-6-phosphate isomerase-like protein (cupin superfamily)
MTAAFPGATGITRLDVYDWEGPDGSCGGSAHVHLLCTEGYVVVAGSGTLQTLGADGYRETPLRPFDIVWFTPGTIHRLINDGDLRIVVVMQNAGLPEAGDFVLTFPPEVLADPSRYAAAASLADGRRVHATDENAARHRKDLAIEGFLQLRAAVEQAGPAALEDFYTTARSLVSPRIEEWRQTLRDGPSAAARLAEERLDALGRGDHSHLRSATVLRSEPGAPPTFGMCGRLTTYDLG